MRAAARVISSITPTASANRLNVRLHGVDALAHHRRW
jgi:hypothetical protein